MSAPRIVIDKNCWVAKVSNHGTKKYIPILRENTGRRRMLRAGQPTLTGAINYRDKVRARYKSFVIAEIEANEL